VKRRQALAIAERHAATGLISFHWCRRAAPLIQSDLFNNMTGATAGPDPLKRPAAASALNQQSGQNGLAVRGVRHPKVLLGSDPDITGSNLVPS